MKRKAVEGDDECEAGVPSNVFAAGGTGGTQANTKRAKNRNRDFVRRLPTDLLVDIVLFLEDSEWVLSSSLQFLWEQLIVYALQCFAVSGIVGTDSYAGEQSLLLCCCQVLEQDGHLLLHRI